MSVTLLVVIKATNGYSSSSAQVSVTSQIIQFAWRSGAVEAQNEIHKSYQEVVGIKAYTTILEGTA